MEENVTYTQMYLDENYIGPIPDMTNLKNIVVSEDNPKYKVVEGALVSKDGKRLYGYPKQKNFQNLLYLIPLKVFGTVHLQEQN